GRIANQVLVACPSSLPARSETRRVAQIDIIMNPVTHDLPWKAPPATNLVRSIDLTSIDRDDPRRRTPLGCAASGTESVVRRKPRLDEPPASWFDSLAHPTRLQCKDAASKREEPMKHLVRILGIAAGLASLIAITAPSRAQEGAKLYVFTSGSLGGFPKAALQIGGQGNIDWAPV